MSGASAPAPHLAAGFLDILFDECDDGWIDVRLIEETRGGHCKQLWFEGPGDLARRLPGLAAEAHREGRAVFFGVLPRQRRGDGSKGNVAPGWVAWADVDFKDTPEADAMQRLAGVPRPSIVVRSGHGMHLYWLMQERTAPAVLEGLSRRLAVAIGADACFDSARILRLPGTLNLKEGWASGAYVAPVAAPVVLMPECDPSRRYNPHDFDLLPEAEASDAPARAMVPVAERREPVAGIPPAVARLMRAHGWLRDLWEGRGRTTGDTSNSGYDLALAGALARCGVLDADVLDAALRARPYHGTGQRTERAVRRAVDKAIADAMSRREEREAIAAVPGDDAPPPHDDGDAPVERAAGAEVLEVERMTDLGNARVLYRLHGRDLRWCGAMPGEGWLGWDGHRWRADDTLLVHRLLDDVAEDWRRKAPAEIALAASDTDAASNDLRKAILGHANRCESARARRAMMEIARSREGIPARASDFDADDYLLGTPTATYDLRALTQHAPRREDMLTRSTSTGATREACPAWEAFLWSIMGGEGPPRDVATGRAVVDRDPGSEAARKNLHAAEMVAFLQRACGYMLTGDCSEQVMFIAHGTGANGKGTFLNAIKAILGDYAVGAQVATFTERKQGGIPNDLAALAGARMVLCSEPEEGAPLAEGLVKMATGQDSITARFLNREFFDFIPKFKLWMMTNHKPVVKGTDNGIWRRLLLVPFTVTIPPEKRDRELPEKLRAEYPAILRWMLDGLKAWRADRLSPPAAVLAASAAYRAEMDILAEFITDRCEERAGATVGNATLYAAYKAWAEESGLRPRSHRWLSTALGARGLKQASDRSAGRTWEGIGLVTREETPRSRPPTRWDDD